MVLTDDSGLYDMQSLASHLKVSRHSIRTWKKAGKIPEPIIQNGRRCYWSIEQIDQWRSSYNFVAPAKNANDNRN